MKHKHPLKDSSKRDIAFIIGAIVMFGIPIALTLATVVGAVNGPDPSPYGYTWSLSLFIVPVAALGVWHLSHPKNHVDRRALIGAAGGVAVLGTILDVMFGSLFLRFPDPSATLGIRAPAWNWAGMQWVPSYLPIEEFGFYVFGGFFVIGSYLWLDQNWLQDYDAHEDGGDAKALDRLLRISPMTALAMVALIAGGILYKRYGGHAYTVGFPGYYVFLIAVGFIPTILFLPVVARFVNWRAFAVAYLLLLLISLIWEATLGVPYGWWGYNYEQMVGVTIRPWGELPIEAVLLWLVVSWAAVLGYEVLRIYFHMDRRPKEALFGKK